jgi:ferredoxin
MHIDFDQDACIGSGICESIAEDVFRIGDDGLTSLVIEVVADERRQQLEEAVSRCPTGAIRISTDS